MLANMASSLIIHKRLTTTVAKAKALRKYVEPLITKSKVDSTHSRRVVFSYLKDKDSSRVLFDEVAERVAERPGGYTRIIKLGNRLGDNAEMCMIELVDFNEIYNQEEKQTKGKTRRSRRGGKKKSSPTAQTAAADTAVVEEPVTEEIVNEEVEAEPAEEATVVEENADASVEVEETPEAETTDEEPKAEDESTENDDEEKPKE